MFRKDGKIALKDASDLVRMKKD